MTKFIISTVFIFISTSYASPKPEVGQMVHLKGWYTEDGIKQKAEQIIKVDSYDRRMYNFYISHKTYLEDGRVLDESYKQSSNALTDYYRHVGSVERFCYQMAGNPDVISGPNGDLSTCHFQRTTKYGFTYTWFSSSVPFGIVKKQKLDKAVSVDLHVADYSW